MATYLRFQVSDEELSQLRADAEAAYLNMPDFLRKRMGLPKAEDRRGKHGKCGRKKKMVQAPLFPTPPAPPESSRRASDGAIAAAARIELADDERDAGE